MKKVLIISLLIICFSLSACGTNPEGKEISKNAKIEQTHEDDKFLKTINFDEVKAKVIAEKLSKNIKFKSIIENERTLIK